MKNKEKDIIPLLFFFSLKDELALIKAKMNEILEENLRLHEELKTSVLQEIMGEGVNLSKVSIWMTGGGWDEPT